MKYWYFFAIGISLYTLAQSEQKAFSCTILNKTSAKIHGSLYYQSNNTWIQIKTESINPNATIILHIDPPAMKGNSSYYCFTFGTTKFSVEKAFLSNDEMKAIPHKEIHSNTSTVSINSIDFNAEKNPVNPRIITIKNDTGQKKYIALYVFKNPLAEELTLTSNIYELAAIDLSIPIAQMGHDVVLLSDTNIDSLKSTISSITLLNPSSITRPILIPATNNDTYTFSSLFRNNILHITNPTQNTQYLALYRSTGNNILYQISSVLPCEANKTCSLIKNNILKIVTTFDKNPTLYLLFDTNKENLKQKTVFEKEKRILNGGPISCFAKKISLGQWVAQPISTHKSSVNTAEKNSKIKQKLVEHKHTKDITIQESTVTEKKLPLLSTAINGEESCSLTNNTSKPLYFALYHKEKKSYKRREKSIIIKPRKSNPIGFNNGEFIALSVSHIELKEKLTQREYAELNTINPTTHKDKDIAISKENFKNKESFDLREITIDNQTENPITVVQYIQKSPGILYLSGISQTIPPQNINHTKSLVSDVSETIEKGSPLIQNMTSNFVVPATGSIFLAYGSEYSSFQETIEADSTYFYESLHCSPILDDKQTVFLASNSPLTSSFFTGKCIEIYNDTTQKSLWYMPTTEDKQPLAKPLPFSEEMKKIIPFYPKMLIIIKNNYFQGLQAFEKPYSILTINCNNSYTYKLGDALLQDTKEIVTQDQMIKEKKPSIKKEKELIKETAPQTYVPEKEEETIEKIEPTIVQPTTTYYPQQIPITEKNKPNIQEIVSIKKIEKNVLRVTNNTKITINAKCYYLGFFSANEAEKSLEYPLPPSEKNIVIIPEPQLLTTRYIVFALAGEELRDTYSSTDFRKLFIKKGRASNIDNIKNNIPITLTL